MMKYPFVLKLSALLFGAFLLNAVVQAEERNGEEDIVGLLGAQNEDGAKLSDQAEIRSLFHRPNAEERALLEFYAQKKWSMALFQMASIRKNQKAPTPTHSALWSLVLAKNKLYVEAIENLFTIQDPTKVNAVLIQYLKRDMPAALPAWRVANVKWHEKWDALLGDDYQVAVYEKDFLFAHNEAQLKRLLKEVEGNSLLTTMFDWQLALRMAIRDDVTGAAQILSKVKGQRSRYISEDLLNVDTARVLYQKGYLEPAITYYKKVSKASPYWADAQEEMGWSYVRKGEPQNALATSMSLMAPPITTLTRPGAYVLHSMTQLKICDYKGVAQTLENFRKHERPRAEFLMNKQYTVDNAPRGAKQDGILIGSKTAESALVQEAAAAKELFEKSLSQSTDQVGFQGRWKELQLKTEQRAHKSQQATQARLKTLADRELAEIQEALKKLHIIEAEWLQQISAQGAMVKTAQNLTEKKKGTTGSQARDKVWFPMDGELWFDEISNYKVDLEKGCSRLQR